MDTLADSLDSQHRQIDRLLQQAAQAARDANWPAYRLHFGTLREGMFLHMSFEEEAMFPLLALSAPAAVRELREEHVRIAIHLETLGAASPEHDPQGCIAELDQLGSLLQSHHQAEKALDPQYAIRPIPSLVREPRGAMDLRGLRPPEPIERIFAALERAPDEPLRVILPHEPVPLYGLLRERGFHYSGARLADGGFELLIDRAG